MRRKIRSRALALLAVVAIVFGGLTILSGGLVLFGSTAVRLAAGNAVPFVLWFNFGAGFAYMAAGIGLLMRHRWAAWLSILIAVATVLVFAGFGLFVAEGGAYETRTAVAMSVRSAFWLLVAAVAIGQREGGTVGGRSLPK